MHCFTRTTALCTLAVFCSSCVDSIFSGKRPTPQGGQVPPNTVSPEEKDNVIPPEMRESLKIQITRLKSDAWWKNCVSVNVAIEGKNTSDGLIQIGCNKDSEAGKIIEIPVHREKCNILKFKLETYKNEGDSCAKSTEPCNGPYSATPALIRLTEQSADRKFFTILNARTLDNALAQEGIKSLISLSNAALTHNVTAEPALGSWTRVFIEDQSQTNLDKYLASSFTNYDRTKFGVDYDDFIFDIKSPSPVKVGFSGENFYVGPKPTDFILSPGCK
jgi:hypothetical protein